MHKKFKLVAMFGIKYEPQWLVDGLMENLKGWVDDYAILDCRKRPELWIHEGDYRIIMREKARKLGADWVMWTSPDERFEKDAGSKIRALLQDLTDNNKEDVVIEYMLKELFHPMWYRNDGVWDCKLRRRIFRLKDDQIMKYQSIQCSGVPHMDYEVIPCDVWSFHLKMIEPENRTMRARVFNALDKTSKFQNIGYDYLDDEKDATLKRIPPERMYFPKYTKKYYFRPPLERIEELENETGSNDSSVS